MDVLASPASSLDYYSSAENNTMSITSYSLFSSSLSSSSPLPPPVSSSRFSSNANTFAERAGRFVHVTVTCIFAAGIATETSDMSVNATSVFMTLSGGISALIDDFLVLFCLCEQWFRSSGPWTGV